MAPVHFFVIPLIHLKPLETNKEISMSTLCTKNKCNSFSQMIRHTLLENIFLPNLRVHLHFQTQLHVSVYFTHEAFPLFLLLFSEVCCHCMKPSREAIHGSRYMKETVYAVLPSSNISSPLKHCSNEISQKARLR